MLARAIKSANDGLAAWWYEHPEVSRPADRRHRRQRELARPGPPDRH